MGWTALIVTGGILCVDIELIRPVPEIPDIARKHFSHEEFRALPGLSLPMSRLVSEIPGVAFSTLS
jgi:hypothetical protein